MVHPLYFIQVFLHYIWTLQLCSNPFEIYIFLQQVHIITFLFEYPGSYIQCDNLILEQNTYAQQTLCNKEKKWEQNMMLKISLVFHVTEQVDWENACYEFNIHLYQIFQSHNVRNFFQYVKYVGLIILKSQKLIFRVYLIPLLFTFIRKQVNGNIISR